MKKLWLFLGDTFDALKPRERVLVFVTAVAVCVGLFVLGVLDPALQRYRQAQQSLQQSERLLSSLSQQEVLLIENSHRDPDADEQAALAQSAREIAALRSRLVGPDARLVAPERMGVLLQALIAAQKSLVLVSISSGEPVDLLASVAGKAPPATPAGPSLYRHEVKLVLQGDYAALQAYLRAVERLPVQLQVSRYVLKTEAWPQATLSITLDFNSLERAWLGF